MRLPSGDNRGYTYGRGGAAIGVSCPVRSTQTKVRGVATLAEPSPETYASVPSRPATASTAPAAVVMTSGTTATEAPRTVRVARSNGTARREPPAAYTR